MIDSQGNWCLLMHLNRQHPPKFRTTLAKPSHDSTIQSLREASVEYH